MEAPVPGVLVIFYNLGDSSLTRARTASDGTFVLSSAPVGVYDLIAYKRGFEPALRRLWHQAGAEQISAVLIELQRKAGRPTAAAPPASIWELRDKLPTDVLRELLIEEGDASASAPAAGAAAVAAGAQLTNMLAGEVRTMADVANGAPGNALSRTAVGLHGGLGNGWQYGISGDYASLGSDPNETTTGNAAGLALDVSPSALEKVTVSTRRNTLSFGDSPASLQAHSVTWSRGAEQGQVESVAARYVEEANLYRATALGTSIFPIASRTWEINARYGRPASDTPGIAVGMTYRYREATVGPSGVGVDGAFFQSSPDADLSASSSIRVSDDVEVSGGVVGRYRGIAGYGIAPTATARYVVGPATVYVRGLYRVAGTQTGTPTVMPRVGSIEESQDPASSQAYAVGIERSAGADSSFQIEASQQKMSELVRAFFEGDFLTDFESVYLLDGNSVRQYRATLQHRLSNRVAGSLSMRYGTIDGSVSGASQTAYGIASNGGRFLSARAAIEVLPTRTGIAVVINGIRQDLRTAATTVANDSDKFAFSVTQDLSVIGVTPFNADWKLLLALESAHGTMISDHKDESGTANRLLGGVAVSF